jgi:hypothetical protein
MPIAPTAYEPQHGVAHATTTAAKKIAKYAKQMVGDPAAPGSADEGRRIWLRQLQRWQ